MTKYDISQSPVHVPDRTKVSYNEFTEKDSNLSEFLDEFNYPNLG